MGKSITDYRKPDGRPRPNRFTNRAVLPQPVQSAWRTWATQKRACLVVNRNACHYTLRMKQPLRGVLAYLLATAVFLIILIAAGLLDPKPVGERQAALPAMTLLVSDPGQTISWLEEPLPSADFSVRGTAVWQSGSQDSGVGLALGEFIVAVSPLGYVLVQQANETVLPWQPWPHVRLGENGNEIWIDVHGEAITVRINRELLWQGNYSLPTRSLGLFGEHFGETAVYAFPALEIFTP